jgi:hypothetical protein
LMYEKNNNNNNNSCVCVCIPHFFSFEMSD